MTVVGLMFHPQQPREVVGPVLAQADALLVILKDDPLFRITVPSKTQSSLAAGRPILMAVAGEAAGLVALSGGGVVVPPGDAAALVAGIRQIASMSPADRDAMGAAGRAYYLDRLSMEVVLYPDVDRWLTRVEQFDLDVFAEILALIDERRLLIFVGQHRLTPLRRRY